MPALKPDMLAIIGGSGMNRLAMLQGEQREVVRTPWGEPSGPISFGAVHGTRMMFIARHGHGDNIAPHEINYRANIWALREKQASAVVSIASVGVIRDGLDPGDVVVPDQLIDYTWGRKSTFHEGAAPVTHVDFTEPFSAALRDRLLAAARACGETVHDGGICAVTQGPRLETAAEVGRLERDGADLVGMTAMPEAVLAREGGLAYAMLAVVAHHAAGRGANRRPVDPDTRREGLARGLDRARRVIEALARP